MGAAIVDRISSKNQVSSNDEMSNFHETAVQRYGEWRMGENDEK